jgi:hypothetical protein
VNGNSVSRYGLGVAALIIIGLSLGIAAVSLRRRHMAETTGATARLAEMVIGLALLTALLELLGTIGWFRLGPIVVASAAIGVVGWRSLPPAGDRPAAPAAAPAAAPRDRPWRAVAAVGIIAVAAGLLSAEWSAPTLQSYDVGIRTFDSLWYHLPWAAWFAQTGHITPLRFTDVEYLTPFYPATAELYHGLGIVLLGHDTLSPAINLAWLGLVLLAAYCVGRPYGIGALTLLGATLALATPMMTLSQAGSAANDIAGVFFLLAAVALLLDGQRSGAPDARSRTGALTLAAVAAGLAVGVKLTLLAPVLALSLGAIWLAPRGRRRAVALRWTGTAFVAGGYWYVRNLIAVGNPLPWLNLPGLAAPTHPLQQHTGFSVAHYLTDSHIWSTVFGPGLKSGLGPWWPAVLAGALIGPLLCLFGGDDRRRVLGLVALASVAAYLITPETAAGPSGHPTGFAFNLRYAAPALLLSLTILPLAPPLTSRRWRALTGAALALVALATLAQGHLWPARHTLGVVLVGVAVGLLVAGVGAARAGGIRAGSGMARWVRAPSRAVAAALAGLLIAGAAAGYAWQRHYLRERYEFNPGVSSLARVWSRFRGTRHVRVGIVGTYGGFFSYPLFGATDSNAVVYIAQHGPHGSFTPITTCRRWRTAVNAGHFRYLVTTPARDPWHPKPLHFSPEGAWTAGDPAARIVYTRRAAGQRISVFLLTGSLDPGGCGRR